MGRVLYITSIPYNLTSPKKEWRENKKNEVVIFLNNYLTGEFVV